MPSAEVEATVPWKHFKPGLGAGSPEDESFWGFRV